MIPKIFHQVWLGNQPIPKQFQEYTEHCKALHSDWEYKLWNENNLRDTSCWYLIEQAEKNSSKSNVARLYAMMKYGGVYSDFDVEWIQNIDHLLQYDAFAAIEPNPHKWIGNAIFGATPNNEWIKYQYDQLPNYVKRPAPWGPSLMTSATISFKNVTKIDTHLFYPYSCLQSKPKSKNFEESYAVHHWTLSWLKKSIG